MPAVEEIFRSVLVEAGQPCGDSFIAAEKECRLGEGQASANGPRPGQVIPYDDNPWKFTRYKNAPDNRGNIVTVADANRFRAALKSQGRLNEDGRTVSLWHVTDADAASKIEQAGMIPSGQSATGQSWKATHSGYATYFHGTKAAADENVANSEGLVAVEVRIPVTPKSLIRFLPDEDVSLKKEYGPTALLNGESVAYIGGVPKESVRVHWKGRVKAGQPCGDSHISDEKECRLGGGEKAGPDKPASALSKWLGSWYSKPGQQSPGEALAAMQKKPAPSTAPAHGKPYNPHKWEPQNELDWHKPFVEPKPYVEPPDPKGVDAFRPETDEDERESGVNGIGFAKHPVKLDYSRIKDVPGLDDEPLPELKPWMHVATGAVIKEADGRIWVVAPKNGWAGYDNTFPKGTVDDEDGLSLQQSAHREVFEESGLRIRLTGHVGDFASDQSLTRYYLAERVGGSPYHHDGKETAAVKLATPEQLRAMLNKTRDRKILHVTQEKFSKEGLKISAASPKRITKPDSDALGRNILANLTDVNEKWLAPVKPVFEELAAKAGNESVSDADFIAAIKAAARTMPALFGRLDTKTLATALERAMGSAMANGAQRAMGVRPGQVEAGQPCGDSFIADEFVCKSGGGSAPERPKFLTSNPVRQAENKAAVEQVEKAAKAGDLAALAKLAAHPSPKVAEYAAAWQKAGKGSPAAPPKAVPAPVKAPKPQPAAEPAVVAALPPEKPLPEALAGEVKALQAAHADKLKVSAAGEGHFTKPGIVKAKAELASDLLKAGAIPDAGLRLMEAMSAAPSHALLAKLTSGGAKDALAKSLANLGTLPVHDLGVLSEVEWMDKPYGGLAYCNMATRKIAMGSNSTNTGDSRHELGHAIHSLYLQGDKHGAFASKVEALYADAMAKAKADPNLAKNKLSHEACETAYGVAGRRGLDDSKENFAEHYRLYHREMFRERNEGKAGALAQYRQRHPEWAKLWDAHYSVALMEHSA
jgi:ADP-ribose pyrophosphatase YjhB (NUDIX family)